MGMFDYVEYRCGCPNCGELIVDFQTKEAECQMDHISPLSVDHFHALCSCGAWVEFNRNPATNVTLDFTMTWRKLGQASEKRAGN